MDNKLHRDRKWAHLLVSPLIWAPIVPLAVLDASLELYHRVCFPLYGLPLVRRASYVKLDRHKLAYLTAWDRVSCLYCGYANGVLRYAAEIAARTEKYWCGIQHGADPAFVRPAYQGAFLPYGDRTAYEKACALGKAGAGQKPEAGRASGK